MTRRLTFFFLCEGSSDEPLVGHLEDLVARIAAKVTDIGEVIGIARSRGGSVEAKLRTLLDEKVWFDFVVIHRDADTRDPQPRISEVSGALSRLGVVGVPVVPVQMTEAWLLLDERAIREVVGRPTGRQPLHLPSLNRVEDTHDPKAVLKKALLTASDATGRRRTRAVQQWTNHRRILLERLDIDGPVSRLPSWKRLMDDLEGVIAQACQRMERADPAENP